MDFYYICISCLEKKSYIRDTRLRFKMERILMNLSNDFFQVLQKTHLKFIPRSFPTRFQKYITRLILFYIHAENFTGNAKELREYLHIHRVCIKVQGKYIQTIWPYNIHTYHVWSLARYVTPQTICHLCFLEYRKCCKINYVVFSN